MMPGMHEPSERPPKLTSVLLMVALVVSVLLVYAILSPLLTTPEHQSRFLVLSEGVAVTAEPGLDASSAGAPSSAASDSTAVDAGWEPVQFPVHWRHQFPNTRLAWYRFDLTRAQLETAAGDETMLGLFIWRVNQTADVWINGQQIGTGGRTVSPMVRHWNSPLYFTLPVGLIRDENEIVIRHFADHSWGSMQNVVIGPDPILRPLHEARYFVQHDVALGLFVFVSITGVFCIAVWYYGRRGSSYLWFAIASVGSSVYCANQFVRYLWIDPDAWRWITNVATDLWACAILVFILRSLSLPRKRAEQMAMGYLVLGVPIYFYASFFHVFDINIYFHIGSLVIIGYAVGLSFNHFLKTRQPLAAFYGVLIGIGLVAGVHDTIMQAIVNNGWLGAGFRYHFNVLHFFAPLSFLALGVNLVRQFIDALLAADRLNAELEQRIGEARSELADNYRVMEEVLVQQSANEERERIYRDLHDDVGSKLLSLYYRLEDESNSTLAKSALEDLRDIVSRKTLESCSLSSAVQQWQVEAFGRATDADVALNWQFDAPDEDPALYESQHAQLRRMLREVLSNAILHNPSIQNIWVHIRASDDRLEIRVENDGVHAPASTWTPGRGISNLRLRSHELDGEFSISDVSEGRVSVAWSIPLPSPQQVMT